MSWGKNLYSAQPNTKFSCLTFVRAKLGPVISSSPPSFLGGEVSPNSARTLLPSPLAPTAPNPSPSSAVPRRRDLAARSLRSPIPLSSPARRPWLRGIARRSSASTATRCATSARRPGRPPRPPPPPPGAAPWSRWPRCCGPNATTLHSAPTTPPPPPGESDPSHSRLV